MVDIVVAAVGAGSPLPARSRVACAIKLTSPGPVFFRQERMGRGFRPFFIFKFRSMVVDAPKKGALVTAGADPRITPIGRVLRATKIDELPQLINVLVGDMSLVGPRPEVRKYVEMFRDDYAEVLIVRPGITDPASIKYRNESQILGLAADPEKSISSASSRKDPLGQGLCPKRLALARFPGYLEDDPCRGAARRGRGRATLGIGREFA